ncbi:MAG: hypothetical protein M2R45_00978 [Verrucomicrobia subdivision 3 bacterium]|nr:hypothetical protein [Limisphaerales bacterium]MCS1414645.1 hypothetical protein [Limisphaerales bacterium]
MDTSRVVCQGSVIQHWLNGIKVIDFNYTNERWSFNVEMLQQCGAELPSRGTNLFLQGYGDPVWYRGLKLRVVSSTENIGHGG